MDVTIMMSEADSYTKMGMKLWLTPGSSKPYWATNASFQDDKVVATGWDFLEASGYDAFVDDGDYSECDEPLTITI